MEPTKSPRVLSDRYELSHLVARGGMAEVYRAQDRLLDRPVALKVLFPELSVDRSFVERFRREAQAAANLSHPNIVPVFDWGEDAGTYYIVMEFVDGRPLSSILRTAGPLHPDRAAEIGADVAGALSYAHRHGVVHRDVKPGNVLITDEGTVKVTDFGIARAVNTEESLTQTGAVMGTATYFSPEQAEGVGVDARSDLYSLGVVLFEMVTGRPPFLGESPVSVASKHVRETPPTPREINPAVPADYEAIVMKCLAKSPEYRYATGDDLRVDLLRFREGRSVAATTLPPTAMQAAAGATQMMGATGIAGPAVMEEEEELPSRTGLYVALLLLLLAALAVVLVFLGQSLGWWKLGGSSTAGTFTLPDVVGQTVTGAQSRLQGDGLQVSVQADPTLTGVDANHVGRTSPAGGSRVHKGQNVVLFTGAPAPTTTTTAMVNVPDFTGQSVNAAEKSLQALGLQSQVQQSAGCTELNVVCSQNPIGGTKVAPSSTVTLVTAQQATTTTLAATVAVPSVTNDSATQACNVLGQASLVCGGQTSAFSTSVPSGQVAGTNPAAGTQVARQSTVQLIISEGPPPLVPNFTGDTLAQAQQSAPQGVSVTNPDGSCAVTVATPKPTITSQNPTANGTNTVPADGVVTVSCKSTTPAP